MGGFNWGNIGNTFTVGGVIYNDFGNTIANNRGWIDAKGNYNSTDILNKQANGKYVRGVQGYRNGYNSALKTAGQYNVAGKVVGGLGMGITSMQYIQGQISGTEFTVDMIMGSIGFIPGWGTAISLTYFAGKALYEHFSGNTLFEKPN